MKQHVFLALSLLVSASAFAETTPFREAMTKNLPSKESIRYHGTQFTTGLMVGVIADAINKPMYHAAYGPNGTNTLSLEQYNFRTGILRLAQYTSVLKVPDMLDQTEGLKAYADKQKTDSGRWAYFLGMFCRSNVMQLFS